MHKLAPIFLALVALQALLVILERAGVSLPLPAEAVSGVRLAVAILILAVLAIGAFREWNGRREGSPSDRSTQ